MDELGIDSQVLYPNSIGFRRPSFLEVHPRPPVQLLCVQLYNDSMAEVQAQSGNRLIAYADYAGMGRFGVRPGGHPLRRDGLPGGQHDGQDPQDAGSPDLGSPAWDPFWETCAGLNLPVHFHIGASHTAWAYYGTTYWPSQDDYVKTAIGGASLFQNNSRLLINSAYSGMFDRYPDLKMVSVESGIGWVPFMLEAMDYELEENTPDWFHKLQKLPSEYFRDNWYATFWFETGGVTSSISSTALVRAT